MYAPAAVSDFLRQTVTFLPTKNGKGLRMKVCAPILNIGSAGVTTNTSALQDNSGDFLGNATFNPISGFGVKDVAGTPSLVAVDWINPVWELISAAFVRYKVTSMKFHYMPQSASTVSDQLVFAFANDPLHPLIGLLGGVDGELTNEVLLALADSIPFMPWREWELDVSDSLRLDQPFYVAENISVANLSDGLLAYSEQLRLSQAGVFACTNAGTTVANTYGVIYLESDIELMEFCPVTRVQITEGSLRGNRKKTLTDVKDNGYGEVSRKASIHGNDSSSEGPKERVVPTTLDRRVVEVSRNLPVEQTFYAVAPTRSGADENHPLPSLNSNRIPRDCITGSISADGGQFILVRES